MSIETPNSGHAEAIGNKEKYFNNLVQTLKSRKSLVYVEPLREFPGPDMAQIYPNQKERAIIVAPADPIIEIKKMEDFIDMFESDFIIDPNIGKMKMHAPTPGGIIWVGGLVKDKSENNDRTRILFYPDESTARQAVNEYNKYGHRESYEHVHFKQIQEIKRKLKRSMSKDKLFGVFKLPKSIPSEKR